MSTVGAQAVVFDWSVEYCLVVPTFNTGALLECAPTRRASFEPCGNRYLYAARPLLRRRVRDQYRPKSGTTNRQLECRGRRFTGWMFNVLSTCGKVTRDRFRAW